MAVRVGEVTLIEHGFTQVGMPKAAAHEMGVLQDHRRQLSVGDRAVGRSDIRQVPLGPLKARELESTVVAARFNIGDRPYSAGFTGIRISPPLVRNFSAISAIPVATSFWLRACSRISWLIFIEQNLGPHIEQK